MRIWYSPYQLYPKGSLNSKTKGQFRKGVILRIRFDNDLVGYADLCPFSEMGDRPLEFELKQIAINKPTEIGARSIYFAKKDAEARAQKIHLFDRTVKIKNHFLVADILKFELDRVEKICASGFTEFKVKMGKDLPKESELVEKLSNRFSDNVRLRIDFNASLSRDRFTDWFDKNQKWLRPCLEYVEDPFAYDAKAWREVSQKWGVVFALDLAADAISTGAEGAQIIVVKPAVQQADKIVQKFKGTQKKFIFTHYMDFPIGQICALIEAQAASHDLGAQLLTCGLQHHDIYEGFTFQSAIKYDGPYILPPEGTGVGFDKLLENQTWTELK
jgi:o-succinylbenzoate synthase